MLFAGDVNGFRAGELLHFKRLEVMPMAIASGNSPWQQPLATSRGHKLAEFYVQYLPKWEWLHCVGGLICEIQTHIDFQVDSVGNWLAQEAETCNVSASSRYMSSCFMDLENCLLQVNAVNADSRAPVVVSGMSQEQIVRTIVKLVSHESDIGALGATLQYAREGANVFMPICTGKHYRCVLLHVSERVVYCSDSLQVGIELLSTRIANRGLHVILHVPRPVNIELIFALSSSFTSCFMSPSATCTTGYCCPYSWLCDMRAETLPCFLALPLRASCEMDHTWLAAHSLAAPPSSSAVLSRH